MQSLILLLRPALKTPFKVHSHSRTVRTSNDDDRQNERHGAGSEVGAFTVTATCGCEHKRVTKSAPNLFHDKSIEASWKRAHISSELVVAV